MAAWPALEADYCHSVLFVKRGSELVPYQRPKKYPLSQERYRLLKDNAYTTSHWQRSCSKKPLQCLESSRIEPWLDHQATLYNLPRPGQQPTEGGGNTSDMSMSFPEDLNATFHSGLLDTTFNVTSAGPAQDTAGDQVVIPDHNDISEDYREQNPAQDSAGDQVVVPPDHNDTSEDYREQNQSLYYTHSDLLNKNEVVGEHQGSQSRQCPVLEAPTHHSDLLNKSQSRQCPVLEAPTQRDLPILFYSRTKPPTKRNIKVPKFSKRSRRK